MQNAQLAEVRVSRHFDAPAELVFDSWLDPENARRWLFKTPTGEMVRCEMDARVGGSLVIVERRNGEDVEHVGEYLEVDRPRRLMFSFAVPKYSQEVTLVTIEIVTAAAGCDLTLTHERVLPEYASSTQAGWTGILEGLASNLGSAVRS